MVRRTGDKNFSETNPIRFITQGMIGNGIFAVLLNNILLSRGATFSYRGEERIEGRKAVRYDYRWPRALGGFEIGLPEGRGNVGEQGSFWGTPNRWILSAFSRMRWKCQRSCPCKLGGST
jgi:hypothetical protein